MPIDLGPTRPRPSVDDAIDGWRRHWLGAPLVLDLVGCVTPRAMLEIVSDLAARLQSAGVDIADTDAGPDCGFVRTLRGCGARTDLLCVVVLAGDRQLVIKGRCAAPRR